MNAAQMGYEVAIVGAGPAGASTALFLLHHRPDLAERILLIEKKRFPRDKVCAGAIGDRSDRLLARIGVEIDVPSVVVDGFAVRTKGGTVSWSRGSIGRVVRRTEFDHALAKAAVDRGAVLREGTPVEDLSIGADGVAIVVAGERIEARVVVGADGVGSRVRRCLGLPFGTFKAAAIEVDTDVIPGDPGADMLTFDFSDRTIPGYAWDFPTPLDGGVKMSRGVYVLTSVAKRAIDVPRQLGARLDERSIDSTSLKTKRLVERGFEIHRAYAEPRALLVGEAAGIDPFNGEGIAPAILYGALAGKYLGDKLRTGALDFADWSRRVRFSTLGLELALSRLLVPAFYGRLRPLLEQPFRRLPRVLWMITGVFSGRLWQHSDLI